MCRNFKNFGRPLFCGLFLFFCVCLLAFFSCNRNESLETLSADSGDGLISVGAGVNLQTKATDKGFELGDTLGIYLSKWENGVSLNTLSPSGNYADNACFHLIDASDVWQADQPYYYPADGSKLDFYAYYPYRAPAFTNDTEINLRVATDQSVYADYTGSDFMTAKVKGVVRSSQKVHLDFYHRLSQIVFVLKPGVGITANDLKQAKVKIINAVTNAQFNLAKIDSVPVAGTTRANITPCGAWTAQGDSLNGVMAIMVPQQINASTYVEVMLGARRFTFKPQSAFTLNPGCSHVFTIRLSNTGIDIEAQIHPWNECVPLSGDAVEDAAIVRMTTAKDKVLFTVENNSDIEIDWGDGESTINVFTHTYTDGIGTHDIMFYGKDSSLINLSCSNCGLLDLDVTRNKALRVLNCGRNKLIRLDVGLNSMLVDLSCYKNLLTELDVTKNLGLTDLACMDNQLTRLDISQNFLLEYLLCSDNLLNSLDISQNVMLIWLSCVNNQIASLDFSLNTALNTLECGGNPLTSDPDGLVAMVNTLPQRDINEKGSFKLSDKYYQAMISGVCDKKNWIIE